MRLYTTGTRLDVSCEQVVTKPAKWKMKQNQDMKEDVLCAAWTFWVTCLLENVDIHILSFHAQTTVPIAAYNVCNILSATVSDCHIF